MALAWPEIRADEDAEALAAMLPQLLSSQPPAGTNVVLVSHSGVLIPDRMGLDIMLGQADAAIFQPRDHGAFQFLGTVSRDEWLGPGF